MQTMHLRDLLQLDEKDPIKRFGQLSTLKDLIDEELSETKPAAIAQIRDQKGSNFTGRFLHTDGRTYEVRTDFKYPNIMTYDKDHMLSAKIKEKAALQSQISSLTAKINGIKDDIVKEHPKMDRVSVSTLAYIRKEAQNG